MHFKKENVRSYIKYFQQALTEMLDDNLSARSIDDISGLLALDYVFRLEAKLEIGAYSKKCGKNLKRFLGNRIIANDNFANNLSFFTIAISPDQKKHDDAHLLNSLVLKDLALETVINMHFTDLSPDHQNKIRSMLLTCISGENGEDIINCINQDPHFAKEVILNNVNKHDKPYNAARHLVSDMMPLVNSAAAVDKQTNRLKQMGVIVAAGAATVALLSLATVIPVLAVPILAMPSMAAAVNLSNNLGGAIGSMLVTSSSSITKLHTIAATKKQDTLEICRAESLRRQQKQQINPELTAEQVTNIELESVKQQLSDVSIDHNPQLKPHRQLHKARQKQSYLGK